MSDKKNNFDSSCVRAGMKDFEFRPVVPPIYQTSTFKFDNTQQGAALFKGEEKGYIYTRMLNPTVEAMEDAVAELENGYKSLGCASGMAAIHTVLTALLKAGDHVVCSKTVYGPTTTLLKTVFSKFNVDTTFVQSSNIKDVSEAVKPETKVIYIETPGNPNLELTDLAEVSKIAKENDALLVVDNTFLGPAIQKPLDLGADVVIHSMTKSLNGHADVVAGIIVVKDEKTYKEMRVVLNQLGGIIDPFNSFLVHRGLKTLAVRMEKQTTNAMKIAEFLESHPAVSWVRYPGLKSHPQYETGQKQHKSPGAMIAFELKGGLEAGEKVMNNVKFCQLAVSLGGVETLVQHPASMTHFSMGKEARKEGFITDGLVRLSVGIENYEDIIDDLKQAFDKIEENK